MSEPLNGRLLRPPSVADLPQEILRRLPHGQWLRDFGNSLMMGREKRNAPVTPFLLGAITHLNRAAQYIDLLKSDVHWLAKDNKLLRAQITALGGIPAPPFRPDAEQDHDRPAQEAKDGN